MPLAVAMDGCSGATVQVCPSASHAGLLVHLTLLPVSSSTLFSLLSQALLAPAFLSGHCFSTQVVNAEGL